jgi:hypothetical protein
MAARLNLKPYTLNPQVKRKNKALFAALLTEQKAAGTLPSYAVDNGKPYVMPIEMPEFFKNKSNPAPVADRAWVDGLLRACEERMDADKVNSVKFPSC